METSSVLIAAQDEPKMAGNQLLVFKLGDEEYAVDSFAVREIDRMKEIRINIVPNVPDYIEGIINMRGDVVPVIDLKKKLGIPATVVSKKQRIIVVQQENYRVGLLVDSVLGVKLTDGTAVLPPVAEMISGGAYISFIVQDEKNMIFVLDVSAVTR